MEFPFGRRPTKVVRVSHPLRRARTTSAATYLVVSTALVLAACSTSSEDKKADSPPAPTAISVKPAANSPEFKSPMDATPDPKGDRIYFTALDTDDRPGVFTVDANGGAVTKLATGDLLVSPFGIAISDDGKTLFVADSGARTSTDEDAPENMGGIFSIPTEGGAASMLPGTERLSPQGLEIANGELWFTGRTTTGEPAVMKIGVAGGAKTDLLVGGSLRAPSGIALGADGAVYVVDTNYLTTGTDPSSTGGTLVKIAGGAATVILDAIGVGYPAGVALSKDGSTAFVSGRDRDEGTDAVYRVVLADKSVTAITDVFGQFTEAAGLHRARGADVFAWADSRANTTGTVFVLGK
ncbi:MAG: hypothetical protein U0169_23850 [Polyangiaceae bacterium]